MHKEEIKGRSSQYDGPALENDSLAPENNGPALENDGLDPELMEIPQEKFRLVNLDMDESDEKFKGKPIGFLKDAFLRFSRNKVSMAALAGVLLVVFMAFAGPLMTPYGYNDQNPEEANLPPKMPGLEKLGILDGSRWLTSCRKDSLDEFPEGSILEIGTDVEKIRGVEVVSVKVDYYKYTGVEEDTYHYFGTDYLGRDLWTRLWRGTRISLLIGFLSAAANCVIGVLFGSIAGYYGGKVDMVMMRICEVINAIPQIVLVTLFILYFGSGLVSIVCALLVQNWVATATLIRSQFYRYKGREYVLAARSLGVSDRKLIFVHILPNAVGPVITRVMTAIPSAIFTESFLAFLGLGIKPPETSIGMLLADGQKVILTYPTQVLFPAIIISVLMVCFNLMSNGLRDAFDPTLRGA